MTAATTWVDRIDDTLNPILVKELRQSVKNRVVIGILTAFLLLQLLMLILGVTTGMDSRSEWSGGQRVFMVQQMILIFTVLTAIPTYAGVRLLGERTDPGSDLMFLTTVRPSTVIQGKLLGCLMLGLLVFSVCAPFMTLAFLLRGIDLITIVGILGLDLLLMLLTTQFAIFVALLPGGLGIKRLVAGIGFLGLLVFTYMLMMFFSFGLMVGSSTWYTWFMPVIPILGFFGYFYFYSVALVSPPTSNSMFPVRLYLFLFSVFAMGVFLVWVWLNPTFGLSSIDTIRDLAFVTFSGFLTPIALIQLVVSACERDFWGPRITRTIPRRGLLRMIAFVFFSGSMGGLLFSTLMFVGCQGFQMFFFETILPTPSSVSFLSNGVKPFWVVALYTFCFALTGMLTRRLFSKNWIKPENTWILIAILLGVLSACPNLIAYMIHGDRMTNQSFGWWNLTNPFYYIFSRNWNSGSAEYEGILFPFLFFWGAALALLSLPELLRQIRLFVPSTSNQPRVAVS